MLRLPRLTVVMVDSHAVKQEKLQPPRRLKLPAGATVVVIAHETSQSPWQHCVLGGSVAR
jgi:hypothetical protein